MPRWLPSIVFFLLATTCVAHADTQTVVAACTPESYEAYQSLADKLEPQKGYFWAMGLGAIGNETLNPLISVQSDQVNLRLDSEKELEDPSCGLAKAVDFCGGPDKSVSQGKSTFFVKAFCALYPHDRVVLFETGFTHMTFLVAYKRTGKHWILVQDWTLDPVVAFSLSADGTLLIDQRFDTDHELWQWNGQSFSKEKEWRSVGFWDGKKYARRNLNDEGEFAGATPECSIAAAHRAIAMLDRESDADPGMERPEKSKYERTNWPIARMRCEKSVSGGGATLLFSLAEWPSVGDEPWYLASKVRGGDWSAIGNDSDWDCLEAIDHRGFTLGYKLFSVEHPSGCPATGPCVRHERWEWKDKDLKQIRRWYTPHFSANPITGCETSQGPAGTKGKPWMRVADIPRTMAY